MGKYTDDEIRAMPKITAKIAADYLGISPMMVTLGMRNNVLPIGFAIKKEDRYSESWSYNIMLCGVPAMPVTATFAQNGSCTIQLEQGSYVVGKMVNQEYRITARIRVGSAEFVMGECEKAPAPFVTWQRNCKNDGDGPPNFFWGHYRSDRSSCIEDFCERATDEYKKQQNRMVQQEQKRTTPKKERGESR